MTKLRNQVFVGTFIHSKSRTALEYLHDSAICVDDRGKIVKVVRDYSSIKQEQLLGELGWESAHVDFHVAETGRFFFPGFIGEL